MELFKKFTETIFYKKDSQLEEQITALKELQQEYQWENRSLKWKIKYATSKNGKTNKKIH